MKAVAAVALQDAKYLNYLLGLEEATVEAVAVAGSYLMLSSPALFVLFYSYFLQIPTNLTGVYIICCLLLHTTHLQFSSNRDLLL